MHLLATGSFTDSYFQEHFDKRQTSSVFIIENVEKQRNSIGLLTNIKIFFLIWNSKYKYHIKIFIQSYLLLLKQQTWKRKMCLLPVLEYTCWASSGIHLLSIFETLGQKLEVSLNIFCGTKFTLDWITQPSPSPPTRQFLDLPRGNLCDGFCFHWNCRDRL